MKDINTVLKKIYKKVKKIKKGKTASYIPELAKVNPNIYGISVCMTDGTMYNIGDFKKEVAIESVAKIFTLSLAIEENGLQEIRTKIGSQGSFLPFNSVIAAELSNTKTLNPFVNAGAMATTSTISYKNVTEYWKKISDNMNNFAGKKLKLSVKTYNSEKKTNQHNKALAYLLKSYNRFYGNVEDTLKVYTKQGSVMVSSQDVAVMAAVFANNGINPKTNKKIVKEKNIKYILGQMLGGGLYEYSDTWLIDIGLPAKSGVGGVILMVVPGVMGVGIVSPPLDVNGNSIKGIKTAEYLSKELNLSILTKPIDYNKKYNNI